MTFEFLNEQREEETATTSSDRRLASGRMRVCGQEEMTSSRVTPERSRRGTPAKGSNFHIPNKGPLSNNSASRVMISSTASNLNYLACTRLNRTSVKPESANTATYPSFLTAQDLVVIGYLTQARTTQYTLAYEHHE